MSLDKRDIGILAGLARALVVDADAARVTYTNLTACVGVISRNNLAILVNRAFKEIPGIGTPKDLAES